MTFPTGADGRRSARRLPLLTTSLPQAPNGHDNILQRGRIVFRDSPRERQSQGRNQRRIMSHAPTFSPRVRALIQSMPQRAHSGIADRPQRCALLFPMTGILVRARLPSGHASPARKRAAPLTDAARSRSALAGLAGAGIAAAALLGLGLRGRLGHVCHGLHPSCPGVGTPHIASVPWYGVKR